MRFLFRRDVRAGAACKLHSGQTGISYYKRSLSRFAGLTVVIFGVIVQGDGQIAQLSAWLIQLSVVYSPRPRRRRRPPRGKQPVRL